MGLLCIFWTLLSALLTSSCIFSAFSPFWFDNISITFSEDNSSFVSFGLLRYCSSKSLQSAWEINEWRDSNLCSFYNIFDGIPSHFWKASFVFYGVGVFLLLTAILLAFTSYCSKYLCGRPLIGIAGILQLVAGMIIILVNFIIISSYSVLPLFYMLALIIIYIHSDEALHERRRNVNVFLNFNRVKTVKHFIDFYLFYHIIYSVWSTIEISYYSVLSSMNL